MEYAKLEDGILKYAMKKNGGLLIDGQVLFISKEEDYNAHGYYRVENVSDDGTDCLKDGVIYHYTGRLYEPSEAESRTARINELKQKLLDTDYEAIKYAEGITTEDEYEETKAMRQAWRAEIKKLEAET